MSSPASPKERLHPALLGFGLLLMAAAAWCSAHPMHDADAFFHMTLARAVLAAGSRVVTEPVALGAFAGDVVVPEWLWGVLSLGVHQVGGFTAVSAMPSVFAAACAWLVLLLTRTRQRTGALAATLLVSAAVMALLLGRMRVRPQIICMVLLPAFMWLSHAWANARDGQRTRLGAALVVTEVLWTQLHGSFILAPCIFVLEALPAYGAMTRTARTATLTVGLLLVAGLTTSAYGFGLLDFLLSHRSGDAVAHIVEMAPPRWEQFNPATHFYGPLYVVLWLMGLSGVALRRRVPLTELGLATMSFVLGMSSGRFFVDCAALLVPWAMFGTTALLDEVRSARLLRALPWLCGALGFALIATTTRAVDEKYGPIGRLGLAEAKLPLMAARRLGELPAGSQALTAYSAGGPLGFLLDGRVRTYVDGRTPLHFDDTDYALSREVFADANALALAIERYGADALVLERTRPACMHVSAGFAPVAVDPIYTTFVRMPNEPGLTRVAACGQGYLAPGACSDGGVDLDAELRRLEQLRSSGFTRFLRAQRLVACGGDLDEARALLGDPNADAYEGYAMERRLLLGNILVRRQQMSAAFDVLEEDIRAGRFAALDVLGPAVASGVIEPSRVHEVLAQGIAALDDDAPPYVRNVLAHVCMAEGDAECVRFHGMRAAIAEPMVRQFRKPLVWLLEHHPSARVRQDASAWLEAMRAQRPPSATNK